MSNQKTLVVMIAAAGLVGAVSSAQAGEWQENHRGE